MTSILHTSVQLQTVLFHFVAENTLNDRSYFDSYKHYTIQHNTTKHNTVQLSHHIAMDTAET
jgi:hypothetical protein